MDLKGKIRNVPDFPKKGIVFRDITTLLKDEEAFRYSIGRLKQYYGGQEIDIIVGAESRGFIFGAVLAHELKVGFVPIRKPGKLPYRTIKQDFLTEYSSDSFEIHEDAVEEGYRVLIIDDLLATGGTAKAAVDLVERLGGEVKGLGFVIELGFLNGREKIKGYDVCSLVNYEEA